MDLRTLRYFQTVASCGSYSRGSELLHISQPAISRAIRKLEDELGTSLFKRHGHGVSLTESGKTLLSRGQSILRQLDQARQEVRAGRTSPAGTISLAMPPAAGHILVPPLIEAFGTAYPNVTVNVVGGFSSTIHEWLVRGRVDVACAHDPLPQRGFQMIPLLDEWIRAGHFQQEYMRCDAVASVLLGTLAAMWPHGGVGIDELVLRSPSPVVDHITAM